MHIEFDIKQKVYFITEDNKIGCGIINKITIDSNNEEMYKISTITKIEEELEGGDSFTLEDFTVNGKSVFRDNYWLSDDCSKKMKSYSKRADIFLKSLEKDDVEEETNE